ncbi:hypothetical protein D3C84_644360 [compost metagenome]
MPAQLRVDDPRNVQRNNRHDQYVCVFFPGTRIKHQLITFVFAEFRLGNGKVLPVRLCGLAGVDCSFELRGRRRYEARLLKHLL